MASYVVFGGRRQHVFKKREQKRNLDAELADKTIFYCTSCKRCYEPSRVNWHKNTQFYDDFVSYGKPRKLCEKCRPDKSANV